MSDDSPAQAAASLLQPAAARIDDGFWGVRRHINGTVTLDAEYEHCRSTGRLASFELSWQPDSDTPRPHHFWDSDVAKWVEAAAYRLAEREDGELAARLRAVVGRIVAAQQDDGYLNSYFTQVAPQARFTDLYRMHELYCAGHLMEAAVAYHQTTGDRSLLDAMTRYADLIAATFGRAPGQRRGYPGHEEIELALVKLHQATGEPRYLQLASYFVDERGTDPNYFVAEAGRGAAANDQQPAPLDLAYCQAHLPVREQHTAEGHAVRAMYLYCGMADVAAANGDRELFAACQRLWANVTERRMAVTGGIGPAPHGERFSYDYDLPNETAYNETCAAVGLVFWGQRMLQAAAALHGAVDGRYADVVELALYNGVLPGVALAGDRFFYDNPLFAYPADDQYRARTGDRRSEYRALTRQGWFDCACCPPNLARLIASLDRYVASATGDTLYVHQFLSGTIGAGAGAGAGGTRQPSHDRCPLTVGVATDYPWDGTVRCTVQAVAAGSGAGTLALRRPGWAGATRVTVNGEPADAALEHGYLHLRRCWQPGDLVELRLELVVTELEAHPAARALAGKVALRRGPLVYCVEQADNGPQLADLQLARDAEYTVNFDRDSLGGVAVVSCRGWRRAQEGWSGQLYRPAPTERQSVAITAIPYYAWANRAPGEMAVWLSKER